MNRILLEYKEKRGQFHYNYIEQGNRPNTQPDTYGWESIAFTDECKADVFINYMNCKLHRREALKLSPYTAEQIRKEWKHFCFIYNSIIKDIEITPGLKEFVSRNFDDTKALARLGNGHFADIKANEDLDWAWEYDPYSYTDSNF